MCSENSILNLEKPFLKIVDVCGNNLSLKCQSLREYSISKLSIFAEDLYIQIVFKITLSLNGNNLVDKLFLKIVDVCGKTLSLNCQCLWEYSIFKLSIFAEELNIQIVCKISLNGQCLLK